MEKQIKRDEMARLPAYTYKICKGQNGDFIENIPNFIFPNFYN